MQAQLRVLVDCAPTLAAVACGAVLSTAVAGLGLGMATAAICKGNSLPHARNALGLVALCASDAGMFTRQCKARLGVVKAVGT